MEFRVHDWRNSQRKALISRHINSKSALKHLKLDRSTNTIRYSIHEGQHKSGDIRDPVNKEKNKKRVNNKLQ